MPGRKKNTSAKNGRVFRISAPKKRENSLNGGICPPPSMPRRRRRTHPCKAFKAVHDKLMNAEL